MSARCFFMSLYVTGCFMRVARGALSVGAKMKRGENMARELTDREISAMQAYMDVMETVKTILVQAYGQLYDDADDYETVAYVNEWYETERRQVFDAMMQGCIRMCDILTRD